MPFDTGRGYRRVERIASAFETRGLEEGAGHASNVDRPETSNQAVPDFLQGL